EGVHPLRTLDGEDFRRLLLSSGVLNYSEAILPELTVDAVINGIREALLSSGVMPSGFSLQEVAYMGVVLEAPASTLSDTPFSFFEQLSEQLKNDTGGGAIYLGMYRTQDVTQGAARLRLIASSQSLPSGIQAVVNDAKREGGTLRDKLRRAVDALDLGDIEEFDLFKTHARGSVARKRGASGSTNGTTNGDEPVRTTPARELHSEPPLHPALRELSRKSAAPETHPETYLSERDAVLEALAPEELDDERYETAVDTNLLGHVSEVPASGHRSQGDSDTYSKLADAFLNATSDSIRRRIARRLDVARHSESALIREHAN